MAENQGLIDKITSMFRSSRRTSGDQSNTGIGTQEEYSKHDRLVQLFKVEQDRQTIIKEANEMYHNDDRCKAVIDNAAEDCTYGDFEVVVSEVKGHSVDEVQELLNNTSKLFGELTGWVKKALTEGDAFIQNVVAGSDIVKVVKMPASTMRRNSNKQDEFEDPLRAFAQVDPLSGSAFTLDLNQLGPNDADWFAEWQIVHARWNRLGNKYGNSIFRSSRGSYKKMREGETDMAIRRKTRAGKKYVHSLEDASDAELEAYKNRNKDILNNPFAAIADFFSNKKTTVTSIEGDAKLGDITDVKHHIENFFAGQPVPKSLVGFGQDINRDILDKQEAQYLRKLEMLFDWVVDQIIRPVFDLQLLLKGILPESVTYSIQPPDRSTETYAEVLDGSVKLKSLGLPNRVILQNLKKVITDLDVDAVLEEMENEQGQNKDKETDAINQSLALMQKQMVGGKGKQPEKLAAVK